MPLEFFFTLQPIIPLLMPYTYSATAPDVPPRGTKINWTHRRTSAGGIRIMRRTGLVVENDLVSGMTKVRRLPEGKAEWVPTRVLKRA